jgi:hypothetical protein
LADVPSTLRQWSATASSNTPNDSTTLGAGLADNLQELQAVTRKYLASQGIDMTNAATIDLATMTGSYAEVTGSSATVTSFGTESAGIAYRLKFNVATTLTHNATSLIVPHGRNVDMPAGAVVDVVSKGAGNWVVANISPDTLGRVVGTLDVSALVVSAGTLTVVGNTTLGGTLAVSAGVTAGSTLAVSAGATVGGALAVSGNATVGGTLTVTGLLAGAATESRGTSGYTKLPSGLYLQWGVVTIAGSSLVSDTQTVTFPIAFPGGPLLVLPCGQGAATPVAGATFSASSPGTTNYTFGWSVETANDMLGGTTVNYIAIGS